MIFLLMTFIVILGFLSFAVDLGRVQLVKQETERAADAAARYGAAGLGTSNAQAVANAIAAAADNQVDGATLTITASDVSCGNWDTTKSPKFSTARSPTNAVQVSIQRTGTNGLTLMLAQVFGRVRCNITATSICKYTAVSAPTATVSGDASPYLAGMPSGTTASVGNPNNSSDSSPGQDPVLVTGTMNGGSIMTFTSISGGVDNAGGTSYWGAEGNTGNTAHNYNGDENGIGDILAPHSGLIGVFLDNTQPDSTAAPATLDFSSAGSRDFTSLSPLLKQPFFIGDGKNGSGTTQQFVVPAGATRLYLAIMDGYQWNNNTGSFTVTPNLPAVINQVK